MFPLFNKKKPIGQHVPGTVGMDGKMVPYDNDKPYRVIPDREEYKSGIVPPQQPVAMDEPRTEPHTVSPMMAVSDEVGNYTAPPPSRGTQGRINEIIGKDYSIEKDDQGNITHRGKDRDKKWSIGDKILSGLSGMFNGDGLIPAATDRNYMEKQADKREMSRLVPQVQQQRQAEGFETDQKFKQTQIEINQIKPEVLMKDAETRAERVQVTARYNELRSKLGQQKADDWKWAQEALIAHRKGELVLKQEQVDLLERRIKEIERHNQATEKQAATNEVGRNTRATNTQTGITARSGMVSADKARGVLASIEKLAPAGSTPEQIEQKRQEYIKTLSPEVRQALGL
jgi:hypothetical protein